MSDINTLPATNEEDAGEPGAKAPRTRERQAPVLLKAGLLWAHLVEAGEKIQGQVHPGESAAVGSLTAQDHLEHPLGEPLHTIFGTGGDPGGRYDMIWNMTVPPAVDYNYLQNTGEGDARRFQQLILPEFQERLWERHRTLPSQGRSHHHVSPAGDPEGNLHRPAARGYRVGGREDRDSLAAERTDILQSPGLVSMSVADVANSISVGDLG
ncbi:hypothetical protein CYMTET_13487 [Cymbomonas tetramitiformis]|uniref:Uncharacterized protein n=1 Tax=Cymbomonas tetramitiformis TaxID=36881 RepID=A0AAE0LB51_9CHLO|nr:hypothetical protein CYMTET_13487 [Cymbomonas tetramitiformis]